MVDSSEEGGVDCRGRSSEERVEEEGEGKVRRKEGRRRVSSRLDVELQTRLTSSSFDLPFRENEPSSFSLSFLVLLWSHDEIELGREVVRLVSRLRREEKGHLVR